MDLEISILWGIIDDIFKGFYNFIFFMVKGNYSEIDIKSMFICISTDIN